jgi:Protein of unknown function DUF262
MSYDPSSINITTRKIDVYRLIPEICFQNARSTWKDTQKSRLIESILIRIPIQSFYVNGAIRGDNKDLWTIIDGQKRLLAIKEYCFDRTFGLQGLEYLTVLEGKSFDEIERRYQRRLLETELTVHSIDTGTPLEVYKSICQRIVGGF